MNTRSEASAPVDTEIVCDLHRHAFDDCGGIPPRTHIAIQAAHRIAALEAGCAGLVAENARLREALSRYEGPNAGTWFYPDGDTSSDACCMDASEVLDERYFDYDGPKTGVFPIERAAALPKIYAAVRAFTDEEKDARDSDDEYEATFHLSEDDARTALRGDREQGGG
jgi:hypothetical protein